MSQVRESKKAVAIVTLADDEHRMNEFIRYDWNQRPDLSVSKWGKSQVGHLFIILLMIYKYDINYVKYTQQTNKNNLKAAFCTVCFVAVVNPVITSRLEPFVCSGLMHLYLQQFEQMVACVLIILWASLGLQNSEVLDFLRNYLTPGAFSFLPLCSLWTTVCQCGLYWAAIEGCQHFLGNLENPEEVKQARAFKYMLIT